LNNRASVADPVSHHVGEVGTGAAKQYASSFSLYVYTLLYNLLGMNTLFNFSSYISDNQVKKEGSGRVLKEAGINCWEELRVAFL
jgi:fructose-1,6-bisphosphatase